MHAQPVSELDLPYLDTIGLERREAVDAISEARARHWLARTELGYSVINLQDVTSILRDQRFHSALSMLEQAPELQDSDYQGPHGDSILTMEGDAHARLRRLVAPAFTPASANRLRPTMRTVVGTLVDAIADRGECELVADVCEPYPIPIICELLGAPPEDWKLFSAWATDIFRIFNNNLAEDLPLIAKAGQELNDYVSDMIAQRRADPRDDLLSDMIAIEQEGDRLSTDEMAMLAQAVLMAGTDTTRNQLACSVALFTEYPEQWALLAERPELASRAVEECDALPRCGSWYGAVRPRGHRVPRRPLSPGDARGNVTGRCEPRPRHVRGSRRLRYHPRAGDRPDDLRCRYPLLHGGSARPGGAPRGAPAPGQADAWLETGGRHRVEALDLRDLGTGAITRELRTGGCVVAFRLAWGAADWHGS